MHQRARVAGISALTEAATHAPQPTRALPGAPRPSRQSTLPGPPCLCCPASQQAARHDGWTSGKQDDPPTPPPLPVPRPLSHHY
eukprot:240617-Chlamydomonas_euryale.AAC.1